MKRLALGAVVSVIAVMGSVIGLTALPSGATSSPPPPPQVSATTWTSAASVPQPASTGLNTLYGVSCTSSSFCAAVGNTAVTSGIAPLIEQWNGTKWSLVSAPAPSGADYSILGAVSCVGPSFCVAVGTNNSQSNLVEQWNGTSWTIVPSPTASGASFADLLGVSCASATFCVSVGEVTASSVSSAVALQWNGTAWSTMTIAGPSGATQSQLHSVTCLSTSWCVAAGDTSVTGSTGSLIETWNGTSWSIAPTPNTAAGTTDTLYSVSCAGFGFCVATGNTFNGQIYQTLIETWNGATWSLTSSPDPSTTATATLEGVDCFSATTCTALGRTGPAGFGSTLAENWNGTSWSVVPTPNQGSNGTEFYGVSCITNWACVGVGDTNIGSDVQEPYAASAPIARSGYRFVASDGGVFTEPSTAPFMGSLGGQQLNAPIVGMAMMPAGDGYYLVAADGGVFTFGTAQFYGSAGNIHLNKPIVGMAVTPDGGGYWLVASDGGIFSYGDAQFYGSTGNIVLNKPIVGMAATPDGKGYYLVASDGGIFAKGDAVFAGSTGNLVLNKPVVGMAVTTGGGYYLVATDGGIFTFPNVGGPPFEGSTGNLTLNKPVIGMTAVSNGYYLGAADGGIFTFPNTGGPPFLGSQGGTVLNKPIVGIAS
jgi:hypothetical protein